MTVSNTNQPLAKPQRTQLENTVKAARDVAETGAQAALDQLAVGEPRAPGYLNEEQKALRRRLRAHGRAVGDLKADDDSQGMQHLIWEVAYEHWHRMLFARFLAENGLLLWEPGAAVSLDDCEALVQESDPAMNLGAKTKWALAAKLAARMLPQVFKPQSPVFELTFAPEHQRELEKLLAALPDEVFKASDSLGWVYQFWQAKRKDAVNASEVKIGADELPAVTQLFTEPYMVDFLLHNSLGAWWVTRYPTVPCPVPLTYLRTLDDGTPAAGTFEGWPNQLTDFKLLDPCCGSGHFLVAAFLMLVPMRMQAEGLSAQQAVDAVLAYNLHGLEIDPRCVEIAVFALALAAWRFPDEHGEPLGVRLEMPEPRIACCGLKVAATPEDWMALVPDSAPNADYVRQELKLLHSTFSQAPLLGSLLDPTRSLKNDLATSSFETLHALLETALSTETPATLWGTNQALQEGSWELALTAKGLLDAARLLDQRYHLVITNVPYLGQLRYAEVIKEYVLRYWRVAKSDLSLVFSLRCQQLLQPDGVSAFVLPQGWLVQTQDEDFRREVLSRNELLLGCNLGRDAFASSIGQQVMLLMLGATTPSDSASSVLLEATSGKGPDAKADTLQRKKLRLANQLSFLTSPKCQIVISEQDGKTSNLGNYADCLQGLSTGEKNRFERLFWEVSFLGTDWEPLHETATGHNLYGGMQAVIFWEQENGQLAKLAEQLKHLNHAVQSWRRGKPYWGKPGITINRMGSLSRAIYLGNKFSADVGVISPKRPEHLLPIAAFVFSDQFLPLVRSIYQKPEVPPSYLVNLPFDFDYWAGVAGKTYPNGLPKPYSDDPTQWLFHGHPQPSTHPLQVAIARLAGYRWPAESDPDMELSDEARTWIDRSALLNDHSDDDGILCLPSVRGELPAHDRLLKLLIASWETVEPGSWKPATLDKLLSDADCAGKSLDVWLRDKFFEQHTKLFHHRPFIWHVWDGLKDGFAALVNYHTLDAKNLERLIHTYLGDWIRQQEEGVRQGVDGAQPRLAAAQDLKRRLELILEGEPPYDIFVRWKPLAEQPIGWKPDLNDGVRLNIRPFMTAEVLRHNKKPKLNIAWEKDRGKDVESAPWFHKFKGERINDHHLTRAEKMAAKSAK